MAASTEQIPDPFQLEDTDETDSSEEESDSNDFLSPSDAKARSADASASGSGLQSPAAQDVPLGSPMPPSSMPVILPRASDAGRAAQIQLPHLPRAPAPEHEVPALFLPGLISPTLFLPIPGSDQLSILLNKYIAPEGRPQRDLSGAWQHTDFHSLVMTNSWRAVARMARDRIVEAPPDDLALIFELWYLRLSSLARLRLFNQAAAECTNFFSVLSAIQPDMIRINVFEQLLPFELEVMHARTKYWAGDAYGYLDELYALLLKCKRRARASGPITADGLGDAEMWKERAVRVGLIIASQLLEMKDHTAAADLLLPLCHPSTSPSPAILSAVGRIYLDSGDIPSATALFDQAAADPNCDETIKDINRALVASARLDWTVAVDSLQSAIEREPDNAPVANNLAVALLSVGRLEEGIGYMQTAMDNQPSVVGNVEPFLFNLATLYELRTAASFDKKCALLKEVAKWAGDGLRANCLKLPPV